MSMVKGMVIKRVNNPSAIQIKPKTSVEVARNANRSGNGKFKPPSAVGAPNQATVLLKFVTFE
ncbi:hypothetical protein GCM10010995_09930 [Cysteiniphilum litorale]|uniref:Uncharacterized protein n=1 Tax=Cysteiniphilum litorale TaxID=2056700 RepID=A0A8J2Z3I6_9GAMM|nr:hypothetical protein GCM10010995_09930 [Cysteiniphilum litorale]